MQNQLYPEIASALAVALVATVLFLGAARTWLVATQRLQRKSRFSRLILFEAGHRLRQELGLVNGRYGAHLAAMLVFVLLFGAVLLMRPSPLPLDVPDWAWMVLCASIGVISLYVPFQTLRLRQVRLRLADTRDAHVAVGHALQRVVSKGNRLFHDVRVAGQVIDNVVVGTNGIYAVNVFVRRPPNKKQATASISGNRLDLGGTKDSGAIVESVKRVKLLGHVLGKLLGHKIAVQSVIAVPGWSVGSTGTNGHLLVNEQTVVTLTGWTRPDAYLMDEDVDKVCALFSGLCRGNSKAAKTDKAKKTNKATRTDGARRRSAGRKSGSS